MEGGGLNVPEEWYYWPDQSDAAYQAAKREWHEAELRGEHSPIPIRDIGRIVFLEHSMPEELRGLSFEELTAAGVRRIPAQGACDFIVRAHEVTVGATLTDDEAIALIRTHLAWPAGLPARPLSGPLAASQRWGWAYSPSGYRPPDAGHLPIRVGR